MTLLSKTKLMKVVEYDFTDNLEHLTGDELQAAIDYFRDLSSRLFWKLQTKRLQERGSK